MSKAKLMTAEEIAQLPELAIVWEESRFTDEEEVFVGLEPCAVVRNSVDFKKPHLVGLYTCCPFGNGLTEKALFDGESRYWSEKPTEEERKTAEWGESHGDT